jgi:hypothetical protein
VVKFFSIVSAALIFAIQQTAFACSCVPPPPPVEALEQSDAVFSGKVLKVEQDDSGYGKIVTFRMLESWKGRKSRTVKVSTADNSAACGYAFRVGKKYLVYAHGEEELHTNICTRTRALDNADGDLEALGPGTPVGHEIPDVIRRIVRMILTILCTLGFDVCHHLDTL